MTRHLSLAVLIAALAMLAACTPQPSNEIATASSPAATSSATAKSTPDAHRFAACLRERGIDVADPAPGGQVELPNKDDKTREALRACAQFAPPSQQQDSAFDPAASRAYAQCVRAQGLQDFPDPDERGPRIPKDLVNDERFKAADQECAHHLNGSKSGGKQ